MSSSALTVYGRKLHFKYKSPSTLPTINPPVSKSSVQDRITIPASLVLSMLSKSWPDLNVLSNVPRRLLTPVDINRAAPLPLQYLGIVRSHQEAVGQFIRFP